ncbi:CMGC/SRPK protein kinase [Saprolegnia diclina VS20]|uniref:non-specific serine/threonine protein kinase n=1 Tax=Saprolegnia diclina (strain VS20) TaxID=1156394 RepID=T0QPL1_SAPDV|nr:CMGC/SRPK protein kinase [Saprolegnia diclina VS20]EQC35790.1 CMGC/SRPK protein kinase [Saprolegnia diclina VS20]|eukprot:XP_008610552.1 CMGC/SRPK protein kinase [Saprolegnia diclina VS20]
MGSAAQAKKTVKPAKWKSGPPNGKSGKKKPMPSLEEKALEEESTEVSGTTPAPTKGRVMSESDSYSSESDASSSESDEEEESSYKPGGYHRVRVGDVYNDRFTVLDKLGWGHFSTVWRCHDATTQRDVAMKVQKSAQHYMEAARDEVELLECVNEAAKKKGGPYPRVVKLIASFEHRGPNGLHMCMVFEMLGDNLLTLIKRYDYKGIPLPLLKVISKQMLEGMAFLHEECKIIHTDLKPENVLLVDALMKLPKLPKAPVRPKDEASMTADERKKLKKRNKRKKQKQKKADEVGGPTIEDDADTALADDLAALAIAPMIDDDAFILRDLESSSVAEPSTPLESSLHEYLVDARTSRDYAISSNFAMRIMVAVPPQFMSAAMGVGNRVYRLKLRIPSAAAKVIPGSRSSTCFSFKFYKTTDDDDASYNALASTILGAGTEVDRVEVWRLELDARYLDLISTFLAESLGPVFHLVNVRAAATHALCGFHFPTESPLDHALQGIVLPSPRLLRSIHERVASWQTLATTRHLDEATNVPLYDVKIADLGNACWTYKHFTQDIQTRQYRSPEVLLGQNYDQSTDMWSMACFLFELATGELLFDPKSGKNYSRDEDHLAQMMELLGKMPKSFATNGKYSKDYFNKKGDLKKIHNLKFWGLKDVLMEKYEFAADEAEPFATFLEAMMKFQPSKRVTAAEILSHPWLN